MYNNFISILMIEIHTELHTNVTIGERGLDFGVLTE